MCCKRIKIAVILILCITALAVITGGYLFFGRKTLPPDAAKAAAGGADWMAQVDGARKLNEITIPGAHDSCAWNSDFSYFSQCQYVDTAQQLNMGIRYLDIRISLDDGKEDLIMTHSVAVCREGQKMLGKILTLNKVLADCYSFLEEHPGETIVFCVKPEDDQALCRKLLLEKLEQRQEMWYTDQEVPALTAVRGRLVLASRFSQQYGLGKGITLRWDEQDNREVLDEPFFAGEADETTALYVQDRYCYEEEDKWNAVRYGLEEKCRQTEGKNALVLQFLSTKGPASLGHPYRYAGRINEKMLDYRLERGRNYGWIIMDFARPDLVRHIYEVNL